MRRLIPVALVALAALTAAFSATAANGHARVTEAAGSGFPGRSYILSLPHGMTLKPGSVQAFENGTSVNGLIVTPVSESTSQQLGVVLAVDASTSMEGAPEQAAFSAARSFAAQRKGREQLALVTYNAVPT